MARKFTPGVENAQATQPRWAPQPRAAIAPSSTHFVLIPSYNTGFKAVETVREAARFWNPVWVVVDGSTDGTADALRALAQEDPAITVFELPRNQGKGAAVLHGLRAAAAAGFTHALTMDADGQHPAEKIPEFMAVSAANPDAQVLGRPVFDESAPAARMHGRKISNWWAGIETLGEINGAERIGDSLYGFRVYPIVPLLNIMDGRRWMRGFDFDPEAAVRLCWKGVRPINLEAPVIYLRAEDGGVSHFNYLRDNLLLSWMHTRLVIEYLLRLPQRLQRSPEKR